MQHDVISNTQLSQWCINNSQKHYEKCPNLRAHHKNLHFFQVVPAGDILRILLPYRKVHLNSMAIFFSSGKASDVTSLCFCFYAVFMNNKIIQWMQNQTKPSYITLIKWEAIKCLVAQPWFRANHYNCWVNHLHNNEEQLKSCSVRHKERKKAQRGKGTERNEMQWLCTLTKSLIKEGLAHSCRITATAVTLVIGVD